MKNILGNVKHLKNPMLSLEVYRFICLDFTDIFLVSMNVSRFIQRPLNVV